MFLKLLFHNLFLYATVAPTQGQQAGSSCQSGDAISVIWSLVLTLILSPLISNIVSKKVAYRTTGKLLLKDKQENAKQKIHLQMYYTMINLKRINSSLKTGENPYCLIYVEDVIYHDPSMKIPGDGYDECIKMYGPIMIEVETLINDSYNVYPENGEKPKWEKSLDCIRKFSRLILKKESFQTVETNEGIHERKMNDLNEAIKYLIEATSYCVSNH